VPLCVLEVLDVTAFPEPAVDKLELLEVPSDVCTINFTCR